jgi:hypothetical protein
LGLFYLSFREKRRDSGHLSSTGKRGHLEQMHDALRMLQGDGRLNIQQVSHACEQ